MSGPAVLTWGTLPAPLRTVARWLTIVQIVGYTTALLFVHHTTGMTPAGAAERYRGSDPEAVATGAESMQFAKSYAEMLTSTHTHLLSMAAIFTFGGVALALCARPSARMRRFLIAEPFAALLTSFGAMWLMRWVDARFSWLLVASSTLMAATFYAQAYFILRDVGWRDR